MKNNKRLICPGGIPGFCGRLALLALLASLLGGCAGFARGMTEALMGGKDEKAEDTRQCFVRGRPFPGLETYMQQQEQEAAAAMAERRVLKVLMVHGIGSHKPGYATRLAENLARALALPQMEEKHKEFPLSQPQFPGELGTLRASRYFNAEKGREMLFFELTWDPVIEKAKQTIAFDNSGEYSFRRTGINNSLKLFVNDTVPDVVLYYGEAREQIQVSVGQSLCWMMSETWETLPETGPAFCDGASPDKLDRLGDDYVFITHSLGSRVTNDALQRIAALIKATPEISSRVERLEDKIFPIFMLSNQLPLLQLGQADPEVHGQIEQICREGSPRAEERLFKETRLIAFSDPNDLFSYAIPSNFLDQHLDSRLCPTLTNVILNVAPLTDLFGLGKLANPMAAHTEYDNDERVIGLIVHGIGHPEVAPVVAERCEWLEAVPGKE
ncbi:MAG: hypothetical protein AB1461_04600 [Thermodesulfobacteriota bacterium]